MIITAGEALVDLVPHAVPGGGPMNTAVACARLGAPTAFLGAVSTDEHGDAIWAHLEASGVDLRLTQRRDEATCRAERRLRTMSTAASASVSLLKRHTARMTTAPRF